MKFKTSSWHFFCCENYGFAATECEHKHFYGNLFNHCHKNCYIVILRNGYPQIISFSFHWLILDQFLIQKVRINAFLWFQGTLGLFALILKCLWGCIPHEIHVWTRLANTYFLCSWIFCPFVAKCWYNIQCCIR